MTLLLSLVPSSWFHICGGSLSSRWARMVPGFHHTPARGGRQHPLPLRPQLAHQPPPVLTDIHQCPPQPKEKRVGWWHRVYNCTEWTAPRRTPAMLPSPQEGSNPKLEPAPPCSLHFHNQPGWQTRSYSHSVKQDTRCERCQDEPVARPYGAQSSRDTQ